MKYNTISEYMGGGYMRPQMYQEGGMSRRAKNILGSAFIGKGVMDAQKSLTEESRQAGKEAGRRSLFGTVGGFLGKYVAPTLLAASGLGGVGLLGSAIAKGLGAGAGRYLGEKVGGLTVEDSDVESPTGFLSSSFEDLKDYREGLGEGAFGRALGTGAGAFITSGGGDYLKAVGKSKLGLPTSDKSVMIRGADGKLVKEMIPSVDTEAILGEAKTPELMQAFKEADTNRRDLMQEYYQRKAPKNLDRLNTEKAFQDSLQRAGELEDMNLREYARQINLPSGEQAEMLEDVAIPEFDDSLPDFSNMQSLASEDAYQASLSDSISLGEQNKLLDAARTAQGAKATAEEASRSAGSLIGYLKRQELDPVADTIRRASPDYLDIGFQGVTKPMVGLDYYNRSGNFPSVNVGDLTVLGGSPRYGMNKGGLMNPMSYARRIL